MSSVIYIRTVEFDHEGTIEGNLHNTAAYPTPPMINTLATD